MIDTWFDVDPPTKAALENCLNGEASFMWGSKAANHQSSFMTPLVWYKTPPWLMVSSLNDRIPLNPIKQSLNPTEIPCKYHITPPFPHWNWGRVAPERPPPLQPHCYPGVGVRSLRRVCRDIQLGGAIHVRDAFSNPAAKNSWFTL